MSLLFSEVALVKIYRARLLGPIALSLCALALGGCGAPGGSDSDTMQPTDGPDPVISLVAAYEMQGQNRPVIFLDVSGLPLAAREQVADSLGQELGVEVLPAEFAFRGDVDLPALTPVDPDTGKTGVNLAVLEMVQLDDLLYEVSVEYVRSGLDGGILKFTLAFDGTEWRITQTIRGSQS